MGAGVAISHNFALVSSGAGIIPFAPYLISTLSVLVFYQKGVIKFDCFCRFLLINFEEI